MRIRLIPYAETFFRPLSYTRGMKRLFFLFFLIHALLHPVSAQDTLAVMHDLYAQGQFEQVLVTLSATETKDPKKLKLKADCYQKLGELNGALDYYEKASLHGYHQADIYLNRGICKVSLGYFDDAKIDFMNYLERVPTDAKAYYWIATTEYMVMENRASMRFLDQAIELDSAYAEAYYLRGANYIELHKPLFALEDFQKAYELNPGLHRAKFNIAVLMLDMENYKGALELLSELKLESHDFTEEVLYYRGETYFRMHDTEGACMEWREAQLLGDEDAKYNYEKLCLDKDGKPKFKRRSYAEF
jgi:tetratricopeptide (TPR) repeat protein